MVAYYGDFPEDATVRIPFNTFSSNDPQASVTITNLVDADIHVHKDGGTTQIVTDGATIAIDYDTITGNHLATIDTSAHADYSIGSDYMVRMEGTTVDGGTINAWIGSFSIENRFKEVAVVTWNGVALGTTNPLPNAPADAAGGLPISDAGALDLDALNTAAVRLTAARAQVLDDWINAGRLDVLLDAIPTTAMRGTDGANTTVPDAAGTAPTAIEIRAEMDSNSTELAKIGTIPALDGAAQTIGAAIAKIADDNAGADFDAGTDSLQAVRDRGDAAWTTGAGGSDRLLLVDTTIATLASQTIFTLTAGSADDDAYNNCTIVIEDVSTATQKTIGMVLDYAGGTLQVTLKEALAFTIATTDKVYILAENSLKSTVANRQLNVAASGQADANITAVSGDSSAADNMEATYDGTGYTDDNAPAKQSQVSSIANVGSAIHRPAASYTLTTGTQSANTYTATEALDGTRHEHTDDTGAMELYYEFSIGAGVPSSVQVTGYVTGGNDDLDVYGYDWVAAGWVQIGNIQGGGSTSNSVHSFDMFVDMVGTGADLGAVRVRFNKASGLTTALLAIDQIFVAFSQSAVSAIDAVYFDSTASNTGTTSTDGVPGNPVSTEAAVNTLLAARNLRKVIVSVGSSVSFATDHDGETWEGHNWTAVGGSRDFSNAHMFGASVSGVWLVATGEIDFHDGVIGTATIDPFHMTGCGFNATLTLGVAGDYVINDGHSAIAGATTPIIDFGTAAGVSQNLSMPDYHNGVEIRNLNNQGTDLFSISGVGQIIYAASSSGAVEQRGDWRVTNTGGVTITEDDNTASITVIEVDTADMQPRVVAIELDTNELQTDNIPGLIGALNDLSISDVLTTQMTEAYAADGAAPTLAQSLMMIQQMLGDFTISGTTMTVREVDGSTTAATFTLNDGTNPTALTRAT